MFSDISIARKGYPFFSCLKTQRLFYFCFNEADSDLPFNLKDGYYHFAGFFHHLVQGCLITSHIKILEGESILLEERLGPLTVRSRGYRVKGDFLCFLHAFLLFNVLLHSHCRYFLNCDHRQGVLFVGSVVIMRLTEQSCLHSQRTGHLARG